MNTLSFLFFYLRDFEYVYGYEIHPNRVTRLNCCTRPRPLNETGWHWLEGLRLLRHYVYTIMADPPDAHATSSLPHDHVMRHLRETDFFLSDDPQFKKLKSYAQSLPYTVESNEHMQRLLDLYLRR